MGELGARQRTASTAMAVFGASVAVVLVIAIATALPERRTVTNVVGTVLVNVVLLSFVAMSAVRLRRGRSSGAALALLVLYGALGMTAGLVLIARGSGYYGTPVLIAAKVALFVAWTYATWQCGRLWVAAGDGRPPGGRQVPE